VTARILSDQTLDARGMDCPLPILQTRKLMQQLSGGATLLVLATDPGSVLDFQAYCRMTGNQLLEMSETGDEFHFLIRKSD
jgi:tRNA 2-thiouridine synthesizing protein A